MNAIKCPNCGNINPTGENFCLQCGVSVTGAQSSDYVSLSPEAHARSFGMNAAGASFDGELGSKVYFWYRIYCILMALLYLFVMVFGILIILAGTQSRGNDATEAMAGGALYTIIGLILFIPFAASPFLPRKPWVWILGIILIALGMTSCCLLPFTIPLLINWLKPETKAFFGRT
jgi:hypothetical protein